MNAGLRTPCGWQMTVPGRVTLLLTLLGLFAAVAQAADRMPNFTLPTLDGRKFVLNEHLGKGVLLITFFATWCEPCAREHPHLQRLYERLGERGLLVAGISIDEPGDVAKIRAHVRRYKLTFPILLDSKAEVARLYAPEKSLPLTMLVDREGRIRRMYQGYSAGDEKQVEKDVMELLGP
ncbi:MAG: TlpA disulfide reductase family protein [Acidobacteriota bacterium]